jgi:hypothetical protein
MFLTAVGAPLHDRLGDGADVLDQRGQERRCVCGRRQARALPGPQGPKIRAARRLGRDRDVSDESSLQRIRQDRCARAVQVVQQAVVDGPGESSGEAPGQGGVSGSASQQRLAMKAAGAGFLACQERRADLDALSAECQDGDDAPGVTYTARGDDRCIDGVDDLGGASAAP